jgi:hypothetical protein
MDCGVDRKQLSIGCSSSLANHSWLDQFLVLLTPVPPPPPNISWALNLCSKHLHASTYLVILRTYPLYDRLPLWNLTWTQLGFIYN